MLFYFIMANGHRVDPENDIVAENKESGIWPWLKQTSAMDLLISKAKDSETAQKIKDKLHELRQAKVFKKRKWRHLATLLNESIGLSYIDKKTGLVKSQTIKP